MNSKLMMLFSIGLLSSTLNGLEINQESMTQEGIKKRNPELYNEAESMSKKAFDNTYEGMNSDLGKTTAKESAKVRDKFNSIKDEIVELEKKEVLKLTDSNSSISNDYPGNLFVFVSLSMPEPLLRSYLEEAYHAGAFVLIKGWKRGTSAMEFLVNDLGKYVAADGKSAGFTMEARYFDRYDIQTVPSIVYAKENFDLGCLIEKKFKYKKIDLKYQTCPKAPSKEYWKISGSVSIWHALDQFKQNKAPVDTYIDFYKNSIKGFPKEKRKEVLTKTPSFGKDVKSVLDSKEEFIKSAEKNKQALKDMGIDIDALSKKQEGMTQMP